jgi:hypothetical protein
MRRRTDEYAYDDYGPPQAKRSAYGVPPMVPAGIPGAAPPTRVIVDLERRNAELVAEVNVKQKTIRTLQFCQVESLKRELQREKERYDDLMVNPPLFPR